MFGVGMPELLVILAVALIVVGPQRLPEMARAIGRVLGQLRAAASQVQQQVEREMHQPADTAQSPPPLPPEALPAEAPPAAGPKQDDPPRDG